MLFQDTCIFDQQNSPAPISMYFLSKNRRLGLQIVDHWPTFNPVLHVFNLYLFFFFSRHLTAQKDKKAGPLSHPSSVDGGAGSDSVDKGKENDLGASLVIGSLLVVPVIFIVGVTVFVRLRKNGKLPNTTFQNEPASKKTENTNFWHI